MTVLRFGLTPKMKPVSPRRAAVVAGLDVGTSKIACLIARLEPRDQAGDLAGADIETGHHGRAPRRHRLHLGREAEAQHGHASPPCAIAGPARLAFSPPLWGRDREGGKRQKPRMRLTPLPHPPPQGGREQTVHAARLMPRLRFSFSYSPSRLP